MFVCDYCRENAMANKGFGIVKSRGACELCHYYDICTDIHGSKCKDNWKELVYKDH